MKKLYRKGTVHPSPPPLVPSDHHLALAFLPPTILTLAVALSPQDRELLAYLISCSSPSTSFSAGGHNRSRGHINSSSSSNSTIYSNSSSAAAASHSARRSNTNDQHPASFNCYCFGCYMSYWVRWDSSPNRQLIHEIIDAFEQDGPSNSSLQKSKSKKQKRRKNNKGSPVKSSGPEAGPQVVMTKNSSSELLQIAAAAGGCSSSSSSPAMEEEIEELENRSDDGSVDGGEGTSVRRFMGFLGEKIWGIWN